MKLDTRSLFGIVLCFAVLFTGCADLFSGNNRRDEGTGSLIVTIREPASAMAFLASNVTISVAEYEIAIEGPGPKRTGTLRADLSSATFEHLNPGSWTITVSGNNSAGNAVVNGSATTTIEAGLEASVVVSVEYTSVIGSLSLLIDWSNAASPDRISVETVLTSMDGIVSFTLEPKLQPTGAAADYQGQLFEGFYFLETTVYDDGTPVSTAVDSVQISTDEVSEVTAWIDTEDYGVLITIEKGLQDPHAIVVYWERNESGTENEWEPMYREDWFRFALFTAEDMFDVRIDVFPEPTTTVEYLWYVNGEHLAELTTESFRVGNGQDLDLALGRYSVTCIVRTETGMSSFRGILEMSPGLL